MIGPESNNERIKEIFKENNFGKLNIKIDYNSLRDFYTDEYIAPNGPIILNQNSNNSAANEDSE